MSKQSDLVSVSQGSGGDPLYIDTTNDRVGIGTSSPDVLLELAKGSGEASLKFTRSNTASTGNDFGRILFENSAGTVMASIRAYSGSGNTEAGFTFGAGLNDNECVRIDNNGTVMVGTTDPTPAEAGSSNNYGVSLRPGLSSQISVSGTEALWLNRDGSDGAIVRFRRALVGVGSISVTGSSTSYNTSSDYRLKENVTPLDGAADRLAQIPVHRFNFIADPDTTVDGFLAHEVQAFVPEAITGEHDGVDADGNPVYQGIDQSKLVPLLTAALQEALQKIDALEARVATLEGN
jgi:hypothetical protein